MKTSNRKRYWSRMPLRSESISIVLALWRGYPSNGERRDRRSSVAFAFSALHRDQPSRARCQATTLRRAAKRIWHVELRIGDSTFFVNNELGGGTQPAAPHHKADRPLH